MKLKLTLIICILLFCSEYAISQGFFKKLEKGLDKFSETLDQVLGTDEQIQTPSPYLEAKIISTNLIESDFILRFTLKSKNGELDNYELKTVNAVDDLGNTYTFYLKLENSEWKISQSLLLNKNTDVEIFAGIGKVDSEAKFIKTIEIEGNNKGAAEYNLKGKFLFKNLAIDRSNVAIVPKQIDSSDSYAKSKAEVISEVKFTPENVMDNILRGKVKEIIETRVWGAKTTKNTFKFNEHGQLTQINTTSLNNNVNLDIVYEYNVNGRIGKRILKMTRKSDDPKLLGYPNEIHDLSILEQPFMKELSLTGYFGRDFEENQYFYEGNKLVEQKIISGDTEVQMYFGSKENIIRRINKDPNNITEYIYDEKGNWISHTVNGQPEDIYEDDGGEEYGPDKEELDSKGRLIRIDGDRGRKTYKYNENGFLALNTDSNRWWGDSSIAYTNYAYDSNKNWTRRTVKLVGDYYQNGITYTSNRVISYYE